MKTLAVLFAGEFRTWPRCAKYMFNFFKKPEYQVDYFFATWSTSNDLPGKTVSTEDVLTPFIQHGKNPVSVNIIKPIGRKVNTFYNQAYLAKVANILKRAHEITNNFVYDQVVETRPDLYLRPFNKVWIPMKDYEFCNCGHYEKYRNYYSIEDVYFRSNSFTNDIIANRYWNRKSKEHYVYHPNDRTNYIEGWTNHHSLAIEYFLANRIDFVKSERDFDGNPVAIRQQTADVDFDSFDNIKHLKLEWQPPGSSPSIDFSGPVNWH